MIDVNVIQLSCKSAFNTDTVIRQPPELRNDQLLLSSIVHAGGNDAYSTSLCVRGAAVTTEHRKLTCM